jgi:pimeloyl-ACP methyl ester carboxylesterase
MTEHYFNHPLVNLHYYKFGTGDQPMLCFHGYGMHGKQFKALEATLGKKYTFYGFDLFFHKHTRLKDESLEAVKKGMSKTQLAELIKDFCRDQNISQFSVIGYSMGSHYATVVLEELPGRISEYIVAAPSCLNPGKIALFLSRNRLGNKLLEKIALTNSGMHYLLKTIHKFGFVDKAGYGILYKEIATYDLRFSFFASATYIKAFITNKRLFVNTLNTYPVKSIFIFGERDRMYSPRRGAHILAQIPSARKIILDENHEMINANFARILSEALL